MQQLKHSRARGSGRGSHGGGGSRGIRGSGTTNGSTRSGGRSSRVVMVVAVAVR